MAIADLDGDTHKDILITGYDGSDPISKIYLNDGVGTFSEDTTNLLTGVYYGSVAIADLDGDTHKDILITGRDISDNNISKIYFSKEVSVDLSSVVTANKWNMIAIADEREVTATNITGATLWTFNNTSNAWEQPTTLKAGEGFWLYTTSTTGYNSIFATSVSSTITDDYTTIKSVGDTGWNLVGISKSTSGIDWSDIYNPTNTANTNCSFAYSFYYDSINESWNTTSNVPYLGAVWIKQNNCN